MRRHCPAGLAQALALTPGTRLIEAVSSMHLSASPAASTGGAALGERAALGPCGAAGQDVLPRQRWTLEPARRRIVVGSAPAFGALCLAPSDAVESVAEVTVCSAARASTCDSALHRLLFGSLPSMHRKLGTVGIAWRGVLRSWARSDSHVGG
jgi:hypothetical protein